MHPTRGMLSALVYNPMGILLLRIVLFQDICAGRLDWDVQLEGELLLKWKMSVAGPGEGGGGGGGGGGRGGGGTGGTYPPPPPLLSFV